MQTLLFLHEWSAGGVFTKCHLTVGREALNSEASQAKTSGYTHLKSVWVTWCNELHLAMQSYWLQLIWIQTKYCVFSNPVLWLTPPSLTSIFKLNAVLQDYEQIDLTWVMLKLNLPFETIFLQYLSVLLFKCDCIKVFLYNSDVFNENQIRKCI